MGSSLRVAVTGGSGHIGHELCKALLAAGHSVINLDRRQPHEPAGKFVYVDVTRREFVQPILEQVDAVCMLGDIPSYGGSIPPEQLFATNTTIASLVMETAADVGLKRIIYTSTCQVYGSWGWPLVPPSQWPIDETMRLRPQNCYGASKVAGENYARMLADTRDVSIAAFRFPWVLTGEVMRSPMGRLRGPWFDGFGTYLHTTDAAQAYVLGLERQQPGFEAYHFSADNVRYTKPLREAVAEFHPTFPPVPVDWPDFKSPLVNDKARSHFGWRPAWQPLKSDKPAE